MMSRSTRLSHLSESPASYNCNSGTEDEVQALALRIGGAGTGRGVLISTISSNNASMQLSTAVSQSGMQARQEVSKVDGPALRDGVVSCLDASGHVTVPSPAHGALADMQGSCCGSEERVEGYLHLHSSRQFNLAHIFHQAAQEMRHMQEDAELRNKDVHNIVADLESVLRTDGGQLGVVTALPQQPEPSPTSSSTACNSSNSCHSQRSIADHADSSSPKTKKSNGSDSGDSSTAVPFNVHLASVPYNHMPMQQRSVPDFHVPAGSSKHHGLRLPTTVEVDAIEPLAALDSEDPYSCTNPAQGCSGAGNFAGSVKSAVVGEKAGCHGLEDCVTLVVPEERQTYGGHSVSEIGTLTSSRSSEILTYDDVRMSEPTCRFQSPRDFNFQSIFNDPPLPSLVFDYPLSSASFASPEGDGVVAGTPMTQDAEAAAAAAVCGDVTFNYHPTVPWEEYNPLPSSTQCLPMERSWQEEHFPVGSVLQESGYSQVMQAGVPDPTTVRQMVMARSTGFPAPTLVPPPDPIRSCSHHDLADPEEEVSPGVHLVNLVISCADAIGSCNFAHANSILSELSAMLSPYGDSMQRVASYFTYGLVARMAGIGSGPGLYKALGCKEPTEEAVLQACQYLHDVCPIPKFCGMAANRAILEAFEGEEDVHVLDLSLVKSWQWISLLQDLNSRAGGPPARIRLTAAVLSHKNFHPPCSLDDVHEAGQQIASYANSLGVAFEFTATMVEAAASLQPWMLGAAAETRSCLAVSCSGVLHKLLHDESGRTIANFLAVLRSLQPRVVCVLEPDANHNGSHFLARFLEALHFYSAIFDSLAAALEQDSPERAQIEQLWFGREIINIVACEGEERVERYETPHQWRARFLKAGFKPKAVPHRCSTQVERFLNQYPGNGFQVAQQQECLILRWKERPLFAASFWDC